MEIDLSLGHPTFVQPFWASKFGEVTTIGHSDLMSYEKEGGLDELQKQIRKIHSPQYIDNANTHNKKIVITNGITQGLCAAMYALDGPAYYAKPPYWFRLKSMVEGMGYEWGGEEPPTKEIAILPNNPNNALRFGSEASIFDCCYWWPQYVNQVKSLRYNHPIMLFGLAKATGHAGSRIGWAIVNDEKVADDMAWYVEMTTGGVSTEAQYRAINILESAITPNRNGVTVFDHAKYLMKIRWGQFLLHKPDWMEVENDFGMFAWVRSSRLPLYTYFKSLGIKVFDGLRCGGDPSYVRISMGCSQSDFDFFIKALRRMK